MMTRRRILTLLGLSPIPAALGWIWARKRKPEPEPEPEYFVIQTSNRGTADEQTTIERITPTRIPR